jgi:hypothetical protein
MTNSPKDVRIGDIGRELCDLLDQQMKAIAGRGLQDLTGEETTVYEVRQKQITALRSELNTLAYPN